jgi:2-keto-4-pentenoate hydratase/2-oxohepta-3-ene-1,7-dioic acid hydratase in catechol pathway
VKLVTYATPDGTLHVGEARRDYVVEFDAPDMRTLFERGFDPRPTGVELPLADVHLKAPIVPKKFFHTAGNFLEHANEGERSGWVAPIKPWIMFFQSVDAIIGPHEPVIYPSHLTNELDYELELTVVIGKSGKSFTADDAMEHVAGYTIFNDITARDIQRREMESKVFSYCKAIDTFCPLGPWIVTADEVGDPHDLAMELRVNGESRQTSHSSRMWVKLPDILAHYSHVGFSAGDLLSLGTVSGVAGFSDDPAAWYLKPGDVMECEIEGLGTLVNPVISWEEAYATPPPAPVTW